MITLFVLGEKGLAVLDGAIQSGARDRISHVVYANNKNVDDDFAKEIVQLCRVNKIKYFHRNKIPKLENSSSIVAAGWRWKIATKDSHLFVFHDSLLPRHRGFNPLVTSLILGEKQIGATVIRAGDEVDDGPILFQETCNIEYPIKIAQATSIISETYSDLAQRFFNAFLTDSLPTPITQNEDLATFSLWRDNFDYFIDWSCDAYDIARLIDATGTPYSGARSLWSNDSTVVYFNESEPIADMKIMNRSPGKILKRDQHSFTVVCGRGLLKVSDARAENPRGNSIIPLNTFRTVFFTPSYREYLNTPLSQES